MKPETSTPAIGSFVPAWASEQDGPALQRLLQQTPMPGGIRVSLECEPDFFKAMVGWQRHHTALARDPLTGEVFGMCSRSIRSAFVNGNPVPVGYLSQLRVLPEHQAHKRRLLKMGFDWLGSTRESFEAPFDVTTLVEGNSPAQRLLTAGLKGLPVYSHVARMFSYLIPVRMLRRACPQRAVSRGRSDFSAQIVECLERFCRRYQFAPHWQAKDFPADGAVPSATSAPMPGWEDFFVLTGGERIAGCAALWDQRLFKQVVVRGYSPLLARLRPLLNFFGAALPRAGEVLPIAWLSHLAVDEDEPQLFTSLLNAIRAHLRARSDVHWLALMFAEEHPLASVAKRLAAHTYGSHLYAVHPPEIRLDLDGRVPHLEGALL